MKREKMRKKAVVLTAAAAMTVLAVFPSYAAGWEKDETGYWYSFESGGYARDQIVEIGGVNYAFNQQAYMVTGWYQSGYKWYYFNPADGAQVTGWLQLNGAWYFLNPFNSGIMQTSWLDQGDKRYYFNEDGTMRTGAFVVDGYYYFAEADGSLRRNKTDTENGITIRYDEEGREWYRNTESELNSKNGGDVWLPVLEDRSLIEQRNEIQENNAEYIAQKKDELSEDFKKAITPTQGRKIMYTKIDKWKERANKQLTELYVPQQEIDSFITAVVQAQYGKDNGSWNYTYKEQNADGTTTTWTFHYWGIYETEEES